MILFLDLETTGLDPKTNRILEVACVLTNDQLERLTRAELFVKFTGDLNTAPVHPRVVEMHTVNGLWAECLSDAALTIDVVDARLAEWLRNNGANPTANAEIYLAGNSIHFDRAFMSEWLPKTLACLHYRQIDLSSVNEMAKRFWPYAYETRPKGKEGHRAMADCLESLELARHYAKALGSLAKEEQP